MPWYLHFGFNRETVKLPWNVKFHSMNYFSNFFYRLENSSTFHHNSKRHMYKLYNWERALWTLEIRCGSSLDETGHQSFRQLHCPMGNTEPTKIGWRTSCIEIFWTRQYTYSKNNQQMFFKLKTKEEYLVLREVP